MWIPLRPIAILIELAILIGIIFSIFNGLMFTLFDYRLDPKYQPFIKWVLITMGFLGLVFFIAHLIAFYPRLGSPSRF